MSVRSVQRVRPGAGTPRGRKVLGLLLIGACLLAHGAMAADCIVSDPYAHTGDQPIAGTTSTATGGGGTPPLPSVTIDTHVFGLSVFEGWSLSLRKLGLLLLFR